MVHPTVSEIATNDYEVAWSGAFIALFTLTLGGSESGSFVISQPHTPFLPGHVLRAAGQEPINLLHVPTDTGHVVGGYRIDVSLARHADDQVELTCTITNTSADARTDQWEIRGTRDDVITWSLAFPDPAQRCVVTCVASDPRAELSAPASGGSGEPVALRAGDPGGTPDEPTVIGTLPADLQPRISWIPAGDVAIDGLPGCTSAGELAIVLPAVDHPTHVTLAVRTTFGGSCPLNTAYLESTSQGVTMTVTPRS